MTERHTRQGLARGQRDPDPYRELADPGSHASANQRAALARPAPRLDSIAGDGCWCGLPMGHQWPGRDDGKPHPR